MALCLEELQEQLPQLIQAVIGMAHSIRLLHIVNLFHQRWATAKNKCAPRPAYTQGRSAASRYHPDSAEGPPSQPSGNGDEACRSSRPARKRPTLRRSRQAHTLPVSLGGGRGVSSSSSPFQRCCYCTTNSAVVNRKSACFSDLCDFTLAFPAPSAILECR